MSNRLFSATGALWHCGPKRVRRTWVRTVCDVLVLLALSALAGWLLHCVRHAAVGPVVRIPGAPGMPLAVVVGPPEMVLATVVLCGVLVLWKVALWIKKWDERAQCRWLVVEPADPEDSASPVPCEDPLALPAVGMPREDLHRILASLIAETGEAMNLVVQMRARWVESKKVVHCPNCGVLAAALPNLEVGFGSSEKRLHGILVCLGGLADRCSKLTEEPAKKDVEVSVVFDSGRFQESLEKARAATSRFAFMVAQRRQWVRVYLAPAAGYRPAHGGYGA